jgi:hypothetical protein
VLAVRRDRPLRPINVVTSPYPGFATDLQSPIMALACLADGASYIRETIYDGRYTLVGELNKMGAKVELDRGAVIVHGPSALKGAEVVAHDLRTGIALVLAGLAAEGETIVTPGYPIDRGHASIAQRFSALGADIAAIPALALACSADSGSFVALDEPLIRWQHAGSHPGRDEVHRPQDRRRPGGPRRRRHRGAPRRDRARRA